MSSDRWMPKQEAVTDIDRLTLIQNIVVTLRRLAADPFDREISLLLSALADEIEHRAREADRRQCSPKMAEKGVVGQFDYGRPAGWKTGGPARIFG